MVSWTRLPSPMSSSMPMKVLMAAFGSTLSVTNQYEHVILYVGFDANDKDESTRSSDEVSIDPFDFVY